MGAILIQTHHNFFGGNLKMFYLFIAVGWVCMKRVMGHWCVCGNHRMTLWSWGFPSIFTWIPTIQLRSLGLHKYIYSLNHLGCPEFLSSPAFWLDSILLLGHSLGSNLVNEGTFPWDLLSPNSYGPLDYSSFSNHVIYIPPYL